MKGKIYEMLEKYRRFKRISFSMPGHKNGKGINALWGDWDVTELSDTDSLHHSEGAVKEACEYISEFLSADLSLIMVNGSTGGIFTMLASVCKRGDKILLSRSSHMSVINACVALGLWPVFFEHKLYERYSVYGEVCLKSFEEKLDNNDIKAVLITSPNYFGVVSDIKKISEILKVKKIPLLVDEAHGAHFAAGDFLPENALALGADMVVQSTHKTLNGLNQSALLHVKSDLVDKDRVKEMSAFFQTSSPAYPIAASAENAVAEMRNSGKEWKKVCEKCRKVKEYLRENTNIRIPELKDGFFALDETRMVFNFSEYNLSGYQVSEKLRECYNVDVEMSDRCNIVLIATVWNSEKDFETLKLALEEICGNAEKKAKQGEEYLLPKMTESEMSPSDAFYAIYEYVKIESCEGRISAATVTVYPPGVPVVVPGAKISGECVEYLKNCGGEITGMKDGKIKVVKEIEDVERNCKN